MSATSTNTLSNRLVSLDVFRGMTIASMMLVNNPGDWGHIYPPLDHAEWNGWTFTDTIFPFFLWIVGVAIPFSLVKRLEQGDPRGQLLGKIFRRALILFAIGLFLNSFGNIFRAAFGKEGFGYWMADLVKTARIMGVLQRIAICYLVASSIVMFTKIRGQILWIIALLLAYIGLMAFGSMPGFPAGDLTKEGNFAHYIDQTVLGAHNWASAKTWDPEGIVSNIPAIATCLFGVMTGHMLRSKRSAEEKTAWIFTLGAILMFIGNLLNLWMPINKSLWTSSYSVFMAGLAMTVFGVCYWLVDIKGHQKWTRPFAIYGMNAITAFTLAGLLGRLSIEIKVGPNATALKTFLYTNLFGRFSDPKLMNPPLLRPENTSLMWGLFFYVIGLYLVCYFLYRKKWFLRI